MNRQSILISIFVITATMWCNASQPVKKKELNVMTFNIRYDNPDDEMNNWRFRKERVINAIKFYDADILGTQEVLFSQLNDMKSRLQEYEVFGVGREDGIQKGEYSPIFYKKRRFELKESGNFWLSETPDIAGSKGWDGACERIATWLILKDKTSGKKIFILNTHLDHVGVEARREGVNLILDKIATYAGKLPVVVTGDFNATPVSDVYRNITDKKSKNFLIDTRTISKLVYGPAWSFHDFGKEPYNERTLIDYIFVKNGLEVTKYGVLAESENEEYLSDHTPVFVTIQLK